MYIIPLNSAPDRRLQILLGYNLLTLRTQWNAAAQAWYLDISGADGTEIALGLKLVSEVNLLGSSLELTRKLGQFRVFTSVGVDAASETNLGTGARLWWFAPGEWEAAAAQVPGVTVLPFDVSTMYSLDPIGSPKRLRFNGAVTFAEAFAAGLKFDGLDTRP
jgi:hypothetical protein